MSDVDIYVFPCPKCSSSGAQQIQDVVSYVKEHGVEYTTMWLDIEGSQYWGSQSSNQQFFEDMVNAGRSAGVNLGVYTSSSQWEPIMGSYTGGSGLPLWYAHYDDSHSFSDFSAFGGWSRPTMKQYNGDQTACGVGVDYNWYPGGGSTATTGNSDTTSSSGHTTTGSSGPGSSGPGSSGPGSSGPGSSGPGSSTHGGTSSSGPGSSGPGSSGPGSSGQTSGTSSGQSTGATDGSNGQTTQSTTGYTGSSGSSGTGEFHLSPNSIYAAKGGNGKKAPIRRAPIVIDELRKETTKTKKGSMRKSLEVPEMDDSLEDSHFLIREEKGAKKFL